MIGWIETNYMELLAVWAAFICGYLTSGLMGMGGD